MKKIKTLALLALLSVTCCLSADSYSKSKNSYEQYKNGFAISIISSSSGTGGLGLAYYFFKNNSAALTVFVSPYRQVKNYAYQKGLNFRTTTVGGVLEFFIPIWRNQLNNSLFLDLGLVSGETFGKGLVLSQKNRLKYAWTIGQHIGLEYRFNHHLYISMLSSVRYIDSQLEEASLPLEKHQTSIGVFSESIIKLTTKF